MDLAAAPHILIKSNFKKERDGIVDRWEVEQKLPDFLMGVSKIALVKCTIKLISGSLLTGDNVVENFYQYLKNYVIEKSKDENNKDRKNWFRTISGSPSVELFPALLKFSLPEETPTIEELGISPNETNWTVSFLGEQEAKFTRSICDKIFRWVMNRIEKIQFWDPAFSVVIQELPSLPPEQTKYPFSYGRGGFGIIENKDFPTNSEGNVVVKGEMWHLDNFFEIHIPKDSALNTDGMTFNNSRNFLGMIPFFDLSWNNVTNNKKIAWRYEDPTTSRQTGNVMCGVVSQDDYQGDTPWPHPGSQTYSAGNLNTSVFIPTEYSLIEPTDKIKGSGLSLFTNEGKIRLMYLPNVFASLPPYTSTFFDPLSEEVWNPPTITKYNDGTDWSKWLMWDPSVVDIPKPNEWSNFFGERINDETPYERMTRSNLCNVKDFVKGGSGQIIWDFFSDLGGVNFTWEMEGEIDRRPDSGDVGFPQPAISCQNWKYSLQDIPEKFRPKVPVAGPVPENSSFVANSIYRIADYPTALETGEGYEKSGLNKVFHKLQNIWMVSTKFNEISNLVDAGNIKLNQLIYKDDDKNQFKVIEGENSDTAWNPQRAYLWGLSHCVDTPSQYPEDNLHSIPSFFLSYKMEIDESFLSDLAGSPQNFEPPSNLRTVVENSQVLNKQRTLCRKYPHYLRSLIQTEKRKGFPYPRTFETSYMFEKNENQPSPFFLDPRVGASIMIPPPLPDDTTLDFYSPNVSLMQHGSKSETILWTGEGRFVASASQAASNSTIYSFEYGPLSECDVMFQNFSSSAATRNLIIQISNSFQQIPQMLYLYDLVEIGITLKFLSSVDNL